MFIKCIKYGTFIKYRGATGSTQCWDDTDTKELDLDDLFSHCNVPDKIANKIEDYLLSKLKVD